MSFPSKQDPNRLKTKEPDQLRPKDIRRFLHRHTSETPKFPSGTRAAYHASHNELGMHFLDRLVRQEGFLSSKVDPTGGSENIPPSFPFSQKASVRRGLLEGEFG